MTAAASAEFHAWSPEHFAALGVSAVIGVVMIVVGRSKNARAARVAEIAFASLLAAQWPLSYWMHYNAGTLTPDNSYPCHFCDIATLFGILALLTHRPFFVEMVYFWGLAGTLQGLVTPALSLNWPHLRFILFFVAHSGVVICALYGVLALRVAPRSGAKWTAFLLLFPFAGIVGFFNWLVGANYGFLCRKPDTASLYDVLGPWPWYIGASGLVGLAFFLLLDLPFMLQRKQR